MGTQHSTVALPALHAWGLSKLGAPRGPEPLLVAFVDTVKLVYQTLSVDEPILERRSVLRKAEVERLHDHSFTWWSKACRSGRQVAVLLKPRMSGGKAKGSTSTSAAGP